MGQEECILVRIVVLSFALDGIFQVFCAVMADGTISIVICQALGIDPDYLRNKMSAWPLGRAEEENQVRP